MTWMRDDDTDTDDVRVDVMVMHDVMFMDAVGDVNYRISALHQPALQPRRRGPRLAHLIGEIGEVPTKLRNGAALPRVRCSNGREAVGDYPKGSRR